MNKMERCIPDWFMEPEDIKERCRKTSEVVNDAVTANNDELMGDM